MHRKYIRATVNTADIDIPIDVFVEGQWLKYQGGKIISSPLVLPSGNVIGENPVTDNAVVRWNGVSGTVIQNSVVIVSDTGAVTGVVTLNGRDPARWVDGPTPATSTDNAIARWDGTTGRLIQNSVVTISDTGAVTGVTTVNGFDPATWVTSDSVPATNNAVALYSGTSGTHIKAASIITIVGSAINDAVTLSGRTISRWTDGPATGGSTDSAVALWDGTTGRLLKNSNVTINTGGDITTPGDMNPTTVAGIPKGVLVKSSGSTPHTQNAVATWDNTAGHPLKDSTVIIDASGNITGALSIGGKTITSLVTASGSFVVGNLVYANNTSGTVIRDVGVDASRIVYTDAAVTGVADNRLMRWDAIGFRAQGSGITVDDSNNISGAGTFNSVNVSAHAARHLGGADSILGSGFVIGDLLAYAGAGVPLTPVTQSLLFQFNKTVAGTVSSAAFGLQAFAISGANYVILLAVPYVFSDTATLNVLYAVTGSATASAVGFSCGNGGLVLTAPGTPGSLAMSGLPPAGIMYFAAAASGNGAINFLVSTTGSTFNVYGGPAFCLKV